MESKSARSIIEGSVLTDYELALYRGLSATKGGKAVKDKAISDAVSKVLGSEVEYGGQSATVAEHLAVAVIGRAIKNGSSADMKNLAVIMGDVGPTKVELVGSLVDEELAKAAIGEDEDGS